jgi:PAS domain S-box-containing protein
MASHGTSKRVIKSLKVTPLRSYGMAVLCVALALGFTLLLLRWIYPTTAPLFLVAVMVSAWYGGWRAGMLATVLSTLAVNYFFIEPFYSLQILNVGTMVRLSMYLVAAGVISLLNQSRRTALKNAREALQALQLSVSQEQAASLEVITMKDRLETVLSSINDGFYVLDRNWRFTYVNDSYCEMVGMPSSEILGQSIWELFPEAIDTEAYVQFHQALRQQTPFQFDYLYAPWNCWHDHRIYPSPTGLTVLIADITDRKQTEINELFLNQLDMKLRQMSDVDAMVAETVGRIGEFLNADRCSWVRINPAEDIAVVEQDWRQQDLPRLVGTYRISEFILPDLVALFQVGQPAIVSDVTTHPDTSAFADNLEALNIGAFLGAPCVPQGEWIATLSVQARIIREWRSDEVALLQEVVARLWSFIEHTRAAQNLRRSAAEFRLLANAMPQIVWVTDANGYLEFINDRWTEYTGLTLEQSRDQEWVRQFISPTTHAQLQADFMRAQETRSPYQSQFRVMQPNGNDLHFLSRALPILDAQGEVYKWYGTSTDVTELKQLEAELLQKSTILNVINESIPSPIYVKDRQGRIIFANPATLEVLGKSEAEVIGYRDCDLYPFLEDAERVMDNDRRIMDSGQMELVEESPDGIRIFLSMKVPHRNEAGDVIGLIGISNDISDRVQIERDRELILQQEQAAREAAERANRIKDEFLAVVSHELRTPLNPILGWSKLLQRGKLDSAKVANALATIERNAQLQSQLIDDLLDISRILRGKLSLNVLSVDLCTVILAALETVHLAAEAKSLQIKTMFSPDVGTVMGDAGRLQQVVWNLFSNAVKFTPANGKITVTLIQTETHAQLQVTDTGKGIHPDFLPFVFEHFRQEDGGSTRQFGGLGLGLAIARQIVELHGGTIAVDSPGETQGATFTVHLPLALTRHSSTSEPTLTAAHDLTNIHILVVDDEPDSREFITFVLEQAGAIVTPVSSGIEALQKIAQISFNLVISDIGMPDMDGYMLMKQIRFLEQGRQVPAIALTAYAGEFDRQQALQAGFQRHLSKPIDPNDLVEVISLVRSEFEVPQNWGI